MKAWISKTFTKEMFESLNYPWAVTLYPSKAIEASKEINIFTNEELEEIFAAARGFIHDLTNAQHRYEYPTANDFLKRKENENKA